MTTTDRDRLADWRRLHRDACGTWEVGRGRFETETNGLYIAQVLDHLPALLDQIDQAEAERDYRKRENEELAIDLDLALTGEEVQTGERYSNATALARAVLRADQAEARIEDALALCSDWEAMGTRQMNIGAVRRALDKKV